MEMGKQTAWEEIDKKSSEIFTASDEIWGCAETAFTEEKSMKILCDVLKAEGFTVETGLADVKTAFKGTFGSGKPVIGVITKTDLCEDPELIEGASEILSMAGAETIIEVGFGDDSCLEKLREAIETAE